MSSLVTGINYNDPTRRITIFSPTAGGGSPTLQSIGDIPQLLQSMTVPALISPDGPMGEFQTGNTSGFKNGFQGDFNYLRALDIQSYIKLRMIDGFNCRYFIGFTDQTYITMGNSMLPTGNYFGISYDSSFDAFNYYAVMGSGSGTNKSPLASADASPHDLYLRLFRDGGNQACQIQLDDIIQTFPTTIPGNTIPLRFVAVVDTMDSASKGLRIGQILITEGL